MNQNLLHTPEGFRDIYGDELAGLGKARDLIKEKMNRFGYHDIQTPSIEFFDVFSKEIGTTPSRELYKFFDKENNTLVLRPDFTPSIARCVAKYYADSDIPVRFCYAGNTFTNISALQGKLCEVTETGSELIGDNSVEADAEIIALLVQCLKVCGLKEFQVTIGEVEFFRGICEKAGIAPADEYTLREYINEKNLFGLTGFMEELQLPEETRKTLSRITDLFGNEEVLDSAEKMADNEISQKAIKRLKDLLALLKTYGVADYVSFDVGMLSKYHYYTGIIFKAYTYGVGDAIAKGGRYDNLLSHFGKDAPAVGFMIVLDDLLSALRSQKIELPIAHKTIALIYTKEKFEEALKKAQDLRDQEINAELIPLDPEKSQEEYLSYARNEKYSQCLFL